MKIKPLKQLLLLGLLPIGALIFYALINVLLNTGDRGLALFFVGASLLATCVLFYFIQARLVRPLETIISKLYDSNPVVDSPDLPELSGAISSYLFENNLSHKTSINRLEEKYKSLKTTVEQLKDINAELKQANELLNNDSKLDHEIDDSLIRLFTYHLKTIVGSTNELASRGENGDRPPINEIKNAAESLLFINKEIKDEVPTRSLENIETWALVDDVLEQLAPVASSNHHTTSVRVNDSCPGRLILAVDEVRGLIFQYLLHYFSHARPASHTVVNVDFEDSRLIINIADYAFPDISGRRQGLLQDPANSVGRLLMVPAEAITSWEEPGKGLTAIVVCKDHERRECMIHRLKQYGVSITSDFRSRELHFCMVDDESSQAFKGIQTYLSPATHLLLLNSNTLYPRKNIHHIKNPLNHKELKQLLTRLKTSTSILHRYRVLAVDDNESNLRLLELQLKELGHHVTTATNGETAVKLYKRDHFDLVILDIQMPGVDGLEATRLIRKIPGNTPPIIGLTAHVTNEEKQAYLDAGMDQVLMKPIRISNLRSILDHHMEKAGQQLPIPTAEISSAIFDYDLAISKANNHPEIADELLQLLITTLPGDLDQINQSATNGFEDELRSSVHRLNGAIRYCGVPALTEAIAQMESRIKTAIDESSDQALDLLNKEVDSLLSWQQENPNPFNIQMDIKSSLHNSPGPS